MTVWIAIILGIVQGLAEFLPISSSGHLLLLQNVFGISDGGMFFTVLLHLGTLAAVLVVYRKIIIDMLMHPVQHKFHWIWLIVATFVTVVIALALKKLDILDAAESGRALGFCFIITAILLVICDLLRKRFDGKRTIPEMKWYHAAFIGFLQGIAPFPGISRSGATITAATACKLSREEAAQFSFLLSIPAIVGGAVLEIPEAIKEGITVGALPCILGVLAAAISGYFAVKFMIRLITKRSFTGFAVYTFILGIFVLLDQFVIHLIKWNF